MDEEIDLEEMLREILSEDEDDYNWKEDYDDTAHSGTGHGMEEGSHDDMEEGHGHDDMDEMKLTDDFPTTVAGLKKLLDGIQGRIKIANDKAVLNQELEEVMSSIRNMDKLFKSIGINPSSQEAKDLKKEAHRLEKEIEQKLEELSPLEEELNEALKTIDTLRQDLQEVNLLNSKLLYVNKVFKANNLTESQKANVIAAFDKAENVKEVKLVFETVSENVVSRQASKPARSVNESKLGSASKATGTTARRPQIISESD
mgnify:CR=1 FL=1